MGEKDDIEVIDVTENDVAVLMMAIKKLHDGIYALKVSTDFLNNRVEDLKTSITELNQALEKNEVLFSEEKQHIKDTLDRLEKSLDKFSKSISQDIKITLDIFLERFGGDIKNFTHTIATFSEDLAAIKTEIKNFTVTSIEYLNESKYEVSSIRSDIKNLALLVSELSAKITSLEQTFLTRMKDLELELQELSLKILKIEKNQLSNTKD